jgi:DNA mismatch repair protein MutS2
VVIRTSNLPPSLAVVLRKLEFDSVLEKISEYAFSESAKEKIIHILPFTDAKFIEIELKKVSEAKEILIAEGAIPLESFKNIIPALKKTTIENHSLSIVELLEIAATIRISRNLKLFFAKRITQYPFVSDYHHQLFGDKIIEHHITDALDEHGFVKDTASKELREIRRSMIIASDALRKRLESILRLVSEKEFLQEDIITTRDGRFVIPIKTEYKHNVPGFIHSTSASGATVFVEPAESLELNNSLRELQLREQREIHRILLDLTRQVGEIRNLLEQSFFVLTEIDVIFAKGKYSIHIIGNPPSISSTQKITLNDARHPILLQHLKREEVIPLSINLGDDIKTLIVTGPNAGGKTVAMKTVGLLAVCAQAGIHISAGSDSVIFPFKKFFVDIGDDQSIEDDLSTFSSHLISMKNILEEANESSLVLIDEIGAGTDPSEGGALAAIILKELTQRNTITIATTHHGILKAFAHQTPGMSNASMEFDQTSLKPTYRFKTGVPGSSYAFELAERLGISADLLAQARLQVGEEKTKLESLLLELERQSQEYQFQLRDTLQEKERLQSLVLSYEQKMTQLKRELGTLRKKAVDEAKQIVHEAHRKVEQSIKDIRESGAEREIVRSSRQVLKQLGEGLQQISVEEENSVKANDLIEKGDFVRVKDGHEEGEVVDVRGKHAIVLCGTARLRIPINELHKQKRSKVPPSQTYVSLPTKDIKNEIDLRGLMGDEAIAEVEHFLDNAYSAGLHRVDIIHGKGTGALRKRIAEFIKSYPHVKSYRLGEWNEGGTGVTVVEL